MKPSDRYSVPLCTSCHALQHQFGELTFWSTLRIDPLNVAFRLWTVSGDIKAGERIVFRARQRIDLMKPAAQLTPAGRGTRLHARDIQIVVGASRLLCAFVRYSYRSPWTCLFPIGHFTDGPRIPVHASYSLAIGPLSARHVKRLRAVVAALEMSLVPETGERQPALWRAASSLPAGCSRPCC
jgi:hypothetical protein